MTKINRKTATHFGKSVKNQSARLKKKFKKAQNNLRVISGDFDNKDTIWLKKKIEIIGKRSS